MSEQSLYFSSSSLLREIDSFFENYPDHAYKNFFGVLELRQKLASYVLDRIFDASGLHNRRGGRSIAPNFSRRCLEQQLQMEIWIEAGIMRVLQENLGCMAQTFPHHFPPAHQHHSI
ncbi:MAG: hypothetical protein KME15_12440 [Drouetiella hepatica Uher 2000/2452]|jgi:hypothetical protein|uniref:Uncharacterized protein n=1 Tax=Drouetiella hepatica Uher 2000/2452 TaxID=904376 RepID=A0A951QCR6_9CYAN|nr:hypothetical protein [Drouetiella hepatica Uher 2000/2452]